MTTNRTSSINGSDPKNSSEIFSNTPQGTKPADVAKNTLKNLTQNETADSLKGIHPNISKHSGFSQALEVISRVFWKIISYLRGSKPINAAELNSTSLETNTHKANPQTLQTAMEQLTEILQSLCGKSYEDAMNHSVILGQILTSKMSNDEMRKTYQLLETVLKRISEESDMQHTTATFDALLSWIKKADEFKTEGKFNPEKLEFNTIKSQTILFLKESLCYTKSDFLKPIPDSWTGALSNPDRRNGLIKELENPNFF